jgi:hypothetical protein
MVVATVGAAMGAAGIGKWGREPCHAALVLKGACQLSTSPRSFSGTDVAMKARRAGGADTSAGPTGRISLTRRSGWLTRLNAVQATVERLDRLEAALVEFVPAWSMAPVVSAFQAMRGVQFITAVTVLAEAGDPTPADGVSWSGAVGTFDGRVQAARREYQDR